MRIRNHSLQELDQIDYKILAVLQADARIAVTYRSFSCSVKRYRMSGSMMRTRSEPDGPSIQSAFPVAMGRRPVRL